MQLENASEGNPIGGTEEAIARAGAKGAAARSVPENRRAGDFSPQISMFEIAADPALEEMRGRIDGLDLNAVTPMEALAELERLQRTLRGAGRS